MKMTSSENVWTWTLLGSAALNVCTNLRLGLLLFSQCSVSRLKLEKFVFDILHLQIFKALQWWSFQIIYRIKIWNTYRQIVEPLTWNSNCKQLDIFSKMFFTFAFNFESDHCVSFLELRVWKSRSSDNATLGMQFLTANKAMMTIMIWAGHDR